MAGQLEQALAENPQALNRPVVEARIRKLHDQHDQAVADEAAARRQAVR
ncbi:MAG: hypothetical protein ABIF71_06345 [Planctomycetota bacterium]